MWQKLVVCRHQIVESLFGALQVSYLLSKDTNLNDWARLQFIQFLTCRQQCQKLLNLEKACYVEKQLRVIHSLEEKQDLLEFGLKLVSKESQGGKLEIDFIH